MGFSFTIMHLSQFILALVISVDDWCEEQFGYGCDKANVSLLWDILCTHDMHIKVEFINFQCDCKPLLIMDYDFLIYLNCLLLSSVPLVIIMHIYSSFDCWTNTLIQHLKLSVINDIAIYRKLAYWRDLVLSGFTWKSVPWFVEISKIWKYEVMFGQQCKLIIY